MTRRVVITGMGTLNPLANNVEDTWKKLLNGESGIDRITKINTEDLKSKIGGELKNYNPSDYYIDQKLSKKMDEFQQFTFATMHEAAKSAKIPLHYPENKSVLYDNFKDMPPACSDPFRMGVLLGVGLGGLKNVTDEIKIMTEKGTRRVSPFLVPKMILNLGGSWVAQAIDAKGINTTVALACASSTNSIGEAFWSILNNKSDIVVTGGFDAGITRIAYSGFINMKALSRRNEAPEKASRPFDRDREGFVMSEGGAIVVLEELEHAKKRGANIIAEFVGYGNTADAYHITSPDPSGEGGIKAMEIAIEQAGIKNEDLDYINAHGTSTKNNDEMETNAVKKLFRDHAYKLYMSSTKSMTGHLLGGAGAIEALIISKVVQENKIPPTINLDNPDEGMDLNYVPHKMIESEVNYAMSNSFGFGGHNTSIIIKKYQ